MATTHSLQLFIGNKRYSSWSLRPWLYLKHHNLQFTEVPVRLDSPEMESKLSGVTPAFRVPALIATSRDGQQLKIWDSLAIMEWASETFSPSGWPADAAARATARSLTCEMHSGLGALRSGLPFKTDRRKPRATWPGPALDKDVARLLDIFTTCRTSPAASSGPWLFGEVSIADAMFAPAALRLVQFCVPALDAAPEAAQEYVKTVAAHPAVQEWVAAGNTEDEELPHDEVD